MNERADREEGATAVEYALIASLIAAVVAAIVSTLGGQVLALLQSVHWW
jgi:Flp pilus assembly pilin Flp